MHSPALRTGTLRFSSSSTTPTASSNFLSAQTITLLSAASLISGLTGFFFATRNSSNGSENGASPKKPQYGSPQDFARAIEEMKKTFADDEDAVSTNADDLYAHGFSVNDYHPGKPNEIDNG